MVVSTWNSPRRIEDEDIEKLKVAKDYLAGITALIRYDNQDWQPAYGHVAQETKDKAMNIVLRYYRGESIRDLPLYW